MKTLPTNKADRLYIMLDRKANNRALVKVGITEDTLKNRIHCYRTSNPLLELVAVSEVRTNYDLHAVEDLFFDYLRETKECEHIFGEWLEIIGEEEIEAVATLGFKYFDKLFYRVKNIEFYNIEVCKLWASRKR